MDGDYFTFSSDDIVVCDCFEFRETLLNFCKDLYKYENPSRMADIHLWPTFVNFFRKYLADINKSTECNGKLCRRDVNTCKLETCFQMIYTHILNNLEERWFSKDLSTHLMNLLGLLYFKDCLRKYDVCMLEFWKNKFIENDYANFRMIAGLMQVRNCDYLDILFDIGYITSLSGKSHHLVKELEREIQLFMSFNVTSRRFTKYNLRRLRNEAIKLIGDAFFQYGKEENNRRMYLAIRAIHALRLKMEGLGGYAERIISNLRKYFVATGESYLSVFEVRSVLYVCFILTDKLKLFDTYCREFDNLMPDCSAKMERTMLPNLTQLSCCEIWKNLRKNYTSLSTAVDMLSTRRPLTESIKRFLLGEVFDVSRHVCSEKAVTQSELALMLFQRPSF